ncbi:MAG TPA: efflux RND transporter periplasmic adaptor subunit [Bacteroidota bacterium]|nr:efflux RND transporter periplasmic adaptor subunit [Bacteroidota bacterium]
MTPDMWRTAFLAGACALIAPACGPGHDSDPARDVAPRVVPVETALAERSPLVVTRLFTGSLEGQEQAGIVAKIAERVTAIPVRVGARVRKGEVTVELDRSGTSSQYYQTQAAYRNAEKSLERMKSLYAEGAVPLQALDGAQTAYDVARANFEGARSAVVLTTPIGGVVTAVNCSLGDLTAPGQVLVTVADVDRMKVTFSLNETDAANVTPGAPVTVSSEARPGGDARGTIVQLAKSADVRSRSFELKAMFPNTADRWYRPGMYVKVRLAISPPGSPLLLPNAAILTDGTDRRVFVLRGGRAFRRNVDVGVTDGERTVILGGVAEHDTVATVGINNLRDSILVRPVDR